MTTSPSRASARSRRWLWILLPFMVAFAVYVFIGSAGRSGAWPVYMTYYDLQAEGFRSGHLYIPTVPAPALLAQADPYDPKHGNLWFWDVSLYKGRYYMYWGPVPALLQALAKSALAIHGMIGDQYLVFAAFSLSALCGGLLIDRMARRLFDFVPGWLRAVMVLAFALANPGPHLIASGGVYQGAIGFGQAFTLAGLLFAFDAVYAAPRARVDWRLPVTGLLWALAIGSRISMLPVTALLALLTALACAWPARARLRAFLSYTVVIATPMVIGLGMLLAYNRLRFDHWLEFGTNVQLSTLKFRVSKAYWLTNLYSYTLRPYVTDCHFPFTMAPWWPGSKAFPEDTVVPPGYLINEPVVGWLRAVPLTWLLLIVFIAAPQRLRLLRQRGRGRARGVVPALDSKPRTFLWCAACLGVLASVSGLLVMGLYMSTMRYLADVTNGLALLGVLGAFSLYSWARTRRLRVPAAVLCCAPALATMSFGLLLGYQGYTGHFKTHNPVLDAKFVEKFSVCDDLNAPKPAIAPPRHRAKH